MEGCQRHGPPDALPPYLWNCGDTVDARALGAQKQRRGRDRHAAKQGDVVAPGCVVPKAQAAEDPACGSFEHRRELKANGDDAVPVGKQCRVVNDLDRQVGRRINVPGDGPEVHGHPGHVFHPSQAMRLEVCAKVSRLRRWTDPPEHRYALPGEPGEHLVDPTMHLAWPPVRTTKAVHRRMRNARYHTTDAL